MPLTLNFLPLVVPHRGGADVKRGILRSILRQAGLTDDELVRLL